MKGFVLLCGFVVFCLVVVGVVYVGYVFMFNDWVCINKVGGIWIYGCVFFGCDVFVFGFDVFVCGNYVGVIFNDVLVSLVIECQCYMQVMYFVICDVSECYLCLCKFDVLVCEFEVFQCGIFVMLCQEIFWFYYCDVQIGVGQFYLLKMMCGDSGYGYGMMQVDDWYYFVEFQQGKGWNMMQNFIYVIDIYFDVWQVVFVVCLGGVILFIGIIVDVDEYWCGCVWLVWSVYNGGFIKVCCWQNVVDVNVLKDNGYCDNYDNCLWLVDVVDFGKVVGIDVVCLMDNGLFCFVFIGGSVELGKLLQVGVVVCVFVGSMLECVDDVCDVVCLVGCVVFDDSSIILVYVVQIVGFVCIDYNCYQFCCVQVLGLQLFVSVIVMLQLLDLCFVFDGMVLGQVLVGIYQVLDFMVSGVQVQ